MGVSPHMRFAQLCQEYDKLERLSGNALRAEFGRFLGIVPSGEIGMVAYMTLGSIASDFEDVNLGIADKMVAKALAATGKASENAILADYKRRGDIGLVAEDYAGATKAALGIKDVFAALHKIAETAGGGSQDRKIALLAGLLRKSTPLEARYIARLCVGKLRLGVASKTILDGLAQAYDIERKDLDQAWTLCPDIGIVANAAVKGKAAVKRIGVLVGRPVQMMLCQRAESIAEALGRLGTPCAIEQKYDGERVQVHKDKDKVTLYSRRLENITHQFPEIVAGAKKAKAQSFICEGEIMGIKGNKLLGFQTLMSRRRKHNIEEMAKEIPVKCFCFELIFLNGKSLIDEPYAKRHDMLQKVLGGNPTLELAERMLCKDVKCVDLFFRSIVNRGGEGVVMKRLSGGYEAGVRGWNWVKWKPEYTKGLQDTFDLVVIGAYQGRGRRSGSYGALLCAVYNEKTGMFESFCKLGSGFSDADLASLPKLLTKTKEKPNNVMTVEKQMTPDIWIAPTKVVEVLAAQITKSPFHMAGRKPGSATGLALRFPRFIRWRDDKKPEQATTTKEVLRMADK
jgi:DNA ligase-1